MVEIGVISTHLTLNFQKKRLKSRLLGGVILKPYGTGYKARYRGSNPR